MTEFFMRLFKQFDADSDYVMVKIKVKKKNQGWTCICKYTVEGFWKLKSHWRWKSLGTLGVVEGSAPTQVYKNPNHFKGQWNESHRPYWNEVAYKTFLSLPANTRGQKSLMIPIKKAVEDIKNA